MKQSFAFLPRGFRSLLDYISPAAFDVIDWKSALKSSGRISKELLFESSVPRLCTQIAPHLPHGLCVEHGPSARGEQVISDSFPQDWQAQLILKIYFLQLWLEQEVFLDLRSDRFQNSQTGAIHWRPNGLWTRFSNTFVRGMKLTYCGFYDGKSDDLENGLSLLQLTPSHLSDSNRDELLALLKNHFGTGKDGPMSFKLSDFMSSFDQLFCFLKVNRVTVPADFLFLGVQLVTLYLHLEELGVSTDVRQALAWVRVTQARLP